MVITISLIVPSSNMDRKHLQLIENKPFNSFSNTNHFYLQGQAKVFLKDIGEVEVLQLLLSVLKEGALSTTCILVNSKDKHLVTCK